MAEYGKFIETLKKMYVNQKIEISKIKKMLSEKHISQDEYNFITQK